MSKILIVLSCAVMLYGCFPGGQISRSHDMIEGKDLLELRHNQLKSKQSTQLNARVVRDKDGQYKHYLILTYFSQTSWLFMSSATFYVDGETELQSGHVNRQVLGVGVVERMHITVEPGYYDMLANAGTVRLRVYGSGKYYDAELTEGNRRAIREFARELSNF
jgi:hypothetical protein